MPRNFVIHYVNRAEDFYKHRTIELWHRQHRMQHPVPGYENETKNTIKHRDLQATASKYFYEFSFHILIHNKKTAIMRFDKIISHFSIDKLCDCDTSDNSLLRLSDWIRA